MKKNILILAMVGLVIFMTFGLVACADKEAGNKAAEKGIEFYCKGKYAEAVKELECAIKKGSPKYAVETLYTILGNTLQELGRYDDAVAAHQKALKIKPDYEKAWVNLGIVYRLKGDYDKARECYEKALAINPNYAELHASLGALFIFQGKPEKAMQCLKKAIQLDPKLATTYGNLAIAYAMAGNFSEADKALQQAIVLGYKNPEAVKNKIKELKEAKRK